MLSVSDGGLGDSAVSSPVIGSTCARSGSGGETRRTRVLVIYDSDLVWWSTGRGDSGIASRCEASSDGDEPRGMLSSSDIDLCFRIGFLPIALTRSNRSSVVATLAGGTGSAAVCNGPYSQVTSLSFSLGRFVRNRILWVLQWKQITRTNSMFPGSPSSDYFVASTKFANLHSLA